MRGKFVSTWTAAERSLVEPQDDELANQDARVTRSTCQAARLEVFKKRMSLPLPQIRFPPSFVAPIEESIRKFQMNSFKLFFGWLQ